MVRGSWSSCWLYDCASMFCGFLFYHHSIWCRRRGLIYLNVALPHFIVVFNLTVENAIRFILHDIYFYIFEPPHQKTNKMACAPSEDSDQPGHPPSLIRSFAVRMKKAWVLRYPLNASEDSDQTGQMPRLIRVLVRRTIILLVLS